MRSVCGRTALPLLCLMSLSGWSVSAQDKQYWTDPATRLAWALADNSSGISLSQAKRYCTEFAAGGFHDWRLPAIDELQTLFGGPANENGRHTKGPIKITGWEWSSTTGEQEGEAWVLDFADGGRASVAAGDSGLNRALCVRNE